MIDHSTNKRRPEDPTKSRRLSSGWNDCEGMEVAQGTTRSQGKGARRGKIFSMVTNRLS